ncbi:GNAT family N-acetyltransferase [Zooshikella marina]|uniref:GNAT family N-acetyltransferase n=1 Tax=Zooshikella ganghwensis TaxID=202772 RepID=UPI001BB0953F|nr:GNAT family N-acetyltransferase [Zooshikella ganghwensis]MBU2705993.1 GNAT family N-acetyltransferase [Zooshikella ganghwensis]
MMNIEVRKAENSDLTAFCMLWQFYQYHQSSFNYEDIDQTGRFDIDDEYLNDVLSGLEECDAYIIFVEDKIAGFATIETTKISGKQMNELSDIFILPKYRKQGVAKSVVETLMISKQYEWHVAIYQNDRQALHFWESMFNKLEIKGVTKIEPPETEGFHEFVVKNT